MAEPVSENAPRPSARLLAVVFVAGLVAGWAIKALFGGERPAEAVPQVTPTTVIREVIKEVPVPAECPEPEPSEEDRLRDANRAALARLLSEVPRSGTRLAHLPFRRKYAYGVHVRTVEEAPTVYTRMRNRRVMAKLGSSGRIEEIGGESTYQLCGVSYPFLAKPAMALLREVATRFQGRVEQRTGLSGVKLCVTSASRTSGFQRKLRRKNSNASRRSTHEWGAAFDIGYKHGRFLVPPDVAITPAHSDRFKTLLGEVLGEIQEEGKGLVIYETGEPCFHVTAVPRGMAPKG